MKQVTIVADDRIGLLADISYILGRSHINIETVSVAVASGKAFISLGVTDADRAAKLLKANNYSVVESDVLVVKLSDEPGELAHISKMLAKAGINIVSVSILAKDKGVVFDAIQVDKIEPARKILKQYLELEK